MKRVLLLLLLLLAPVFFLSAEEAEDEETAAPEEKTNAQKRNEEGIGLEVGLGVGAGYSSDGFGLALKPALAFDILHSGFVIGIEDWPIPLVPEPSGGELSVFEEFGFDLGDTIFGLAFANSNTFDLSGAAGAEGSVSASFRLTDKEVDLFALELSCSYLRESAWEFGLAASVGGGYEFDFRDLGSLALWAEIGITLYDAPAVDEISLSIAYEIRFGLFYLNLEIAPSLVPADPAEFNFEATLACGLYL